MGKVRKPKLGQNFLVDEAAQQRIADALGDLSQRTVLEIGPGHGAITRLLASRAKRLVAIELDRALAAELRFRYREQPQVEVVEQDVLSADLAALAQDEAGFDIVGNLPYYITSGILLHLFAAATASAASKPVRAVLMMQREVAERVAAAPGVRDYGLLSATSQMYAEVELLFTLPPAAFQPPPEVFSTVLRLHFRPRFTELGVAAAAFDRFLHQAFAQKRKTLRNNLRAAGFDPVQVQTAWPADLPSQARAEELRLETFAHLFRNLDTDNASVSGPGWPAR